MQPGPAALASAEGGDLPEPAAAFDARPERTREPAEWLDIAAAATHRHHHAGRAGARGRRGPARGTGGRDLRSEPGDVVSDSLREGGARPARPGTAARIAFARYVVPWQAGESPGNAYREGFEAWRESAARAGLKTDLAITLYAGRVPTPRQYRAAVASLLAGHPVQYLEAWNEPNHIAQLRADESLAPRYMREAAALCALDGCQPIAGDFLDEAGSARFRGAVQAAARGPRRQRARVGHPPVCVRQRRERHGSDRDRAAARSPARNCGSPRPAPTTASPGATSGPHRWRRRSQRAAAERLIGHGRPGSRRLARLLLRPLRRRGQVALPNRRH